MTLNRARALVGEVAAALGGEPAGDPRRGCELSTRFAVVVPQERLADAEGLPQLVAVLERDETAGRRRHRGRLPDRGDRRRRRRAGIATSSARSARRSGSLRTANRPPEPLPPPELRELDAPAPPPDLLELGDIRGDLHVHTTASDGKATVEEMGRAAQALGYEYLAICDHTRNVRVVPGLDADDLRRQARGDRRRERGAGAVPDPARERVRHPPGRVARPPRRRARRARMGADQPPRRPARAARGDHRPRRRGDAPSRPPRASRTRRAGSSTTAPRTRSTSTASSRSRSRRASRSR